MINLPFLPVLLPLLTGIILIFFGKHTVWQRRLSFISSLGGVVLSGWLLHSVYTKGVLTLEVGSWEAPFGIIIVADMLAALLVLTSNLIVFSVVVYSFTSIGREREKVYYYSMVQFLLVGVNGAFLTGDLFNLFVFFEVMLMASYVLLVLGGTKVQLRETIKYLLVNIVASALFVISVAWLYSVTGTLNMAHLGERIAEAGQPAIITVIAIAFLIVFGLKGGIFPLFYWLPGSYAAPPVPVIALFGSLLTKVGLYAIFRTYSLMFYHDQAYTHSLLEILAILTIIIGVIGAAGYKDVTKIIIYNIIIAIGVIAFGFSLMNEAGIMGSVYYMVHDMIIKAALFLLIGIMIRLAGTGSLKGMGGMIRQYPVLGWTFFIAAISLAGIPPFSGFTGKLLILQGAAEKGAYTGMAAVLISSLFVLYSVMKIFIRGFWGKEREYSAGVPVKRMLVPAVFLTGISVLYGIGAEAVYPYIHHAAETMLNPAVYIDAVLKE